VNALRRRIGAVLVLVVTSTPVAARTALAEEGEASGCIRRAGICVTVRAGGATSSAPTRRRSSDSPLVWRQITVAQGCPNLADTGDILAPPDASLSGRPLVVRRLVDTRTGETVRLEPAYCPAPATAPSPSARFAQAVRNERQLVGLLRLDPAGNGLAGLETWLWVEVPSQGVSVSAGLGGIGGEARATPVRFRWDMGDGTAYSSTTPGTRALPAARHTYSATGDYRVVLTVTWRGTFASSRSGVASAPAELGEVDVDYERLYHVVEARAVRR